MIVKNQEKQGWGRSMVENLSKDLKASFPDIKFGFSERNLWNMRQFYLAYDSNEKLQQLAAEIGWMSNILIINKIKESSFKLITAGGSTFTMSVKVNQTPETVTVKGREIKCYKVTMKPDMGWLSMVLLELNFWYEVKSPHDFVRYAGLESGLGSPDIIQEVIN